MAASDAFTKIVFSATGGDAVAREVKKIQKAYEDAGKAGKEVGKSVGVSTETAMAGGYASGMGLGKELREFFEQREAANAERRKDAEARSSRKKEVRDRYDTAGSAPGAIGTAGQAMQEANDNTARGLGTGMRSVGGTVYNYAVQQQMQQAAQQQQQQAPPPPPPAPVDNTAPGDTDTAKDVGGEASKVGSTLPYAGAVIAGIGTVLHVIASMAEKEYQRTMAVWGSGIGQRAGMDYGQSRAEFIRMGTTGVPKQAVLGYMGALGSSGGTYTDVNKGDNDLAMFTMMKYGVDPGIMGRYMGLRGQAGLHDKGSSRILGPQNMGQGLIGRFMSTVMGQMEQGMARGIAPGQGVEDLGLSTSNMMSKLMQSKTGGGGGLTYTGAEALTNKLGQPFAGGGILPGSSQELMNYFQLRRKGESAVDFMARSQSDPIEMARQKLEYMKRVTGGDKESLMLEMAGSGMGINALQAKALQGMDMSRAGMMSYAGREWSTTPGQGAGVVKQFQQELFEGAQSASVQALGMLNDGVSKIISLISVLTGQHVPVSTGK